MNVDWYVDEEPGRIASGLPFANASNRYRVALPATSLSAQGCQVRVRSIRSMGTSDHDPDVVVLAKLFNPRDDAVFESRAHMTLGALAAARRAGARIVSDHCDDHFERPGWDMYCRAVAAESDLCVAASDHMATVLARYTRAPVLRVDDPIASPEGEPRVFRREPLLLRLVHRRLGGTRSRQRLRLVWYGHSTNSPPIVEWAQRLVALSRQQPWLLTLVTNPTDWLNDEVRRFNGQYTPGAFLEVHPWSEATQWDAVAAADVVLLPAHTDQAAKLVKSNNRLTDALNVGRHVIASAVPAYLPYEKLVAITDDPVLALRRYLAHPYEALQQLRAAQGLARQRVSAAEIGRQWRRALDLALQTPPKSGDPGGQSLAPQDVPRAPVKLNLGCGDKILDGYVNVDVVASRAGRQPDVVCDLHRLTPFSDEHADEVLAVHVVEHFWRWEIEEVLREWARVLKPGGRMVIECPNLRSACEAFLSEPASSTPHERQDQLTMWVFYGDPRWKDPLMVHRWGYTPETLISLLRSVGLVDARQEPAQFKLKEPRDMRVVAHKPLRPGTDVAL